MWGIRSRTVVGGFGFVLLQASCATRQAAQAGNFSNLQVLEIRGELSYRERIALPPQSIALVELSDVSIADAPSILLAQQRLNLGDRQVPVPFRLIVDKTRLSSGRRYSLRGSIIGPDQQLLWTATQSQALESARANSDLGILMMTRVSAQGPAQPVASNPQAGTITASGNEPGWKLEINQREMILLLNNGARRVAAPVSAPLIADDMRRYLTTAEGQPFAATITNRPCADTMSGMPHPTTVVVSLASQELRGCGGNPAEVLHGEWRVQNLNGRVIEGDLLGTLNFAPGGALSGRSFCNSYTGKYTLTGESLSIAPGASTLMACLSPAGALEKTFMDLLGSVRRFEISANGSLILHTGAGRTLSARRP
jgi:uncharacterized lipoprotein YbaY/heat shock protein HslJ